MAGDLIDALRRYKNVIAEGVPGTGKTFAIRAVSAGWKTLTDRELAPVTMMTLHPSTGYEEFVEGIRPEQGNTGLRFDHVTPSSGPTSFKLQHGFFLRECIRAMGDPDRDFLVVLDELNRANVPRVFGDLLLLLEPSKRARHDGADWVGDETVLPNSGSRLLVPENLHVLGTMNTTDRSVTPLDAALRRRFAFVRLEPMSPEELASEAEDLPGAIRAVFNEHVEAWHELNQDVLRPVLGADGLLGHSYLFGLLDELRANVDPVVHQLKAVADASSHTAWAQIGKMTGGARNQFNLAQRGNKNPNRGPMHTLLPSGAPSNQYFDLKFAGDVFAGCEMRLQNASQHSSGSWQVFLRGQTASGEKFQEHHADAFSDSVGIFGWDNQQADLVRAAVVPLSMIPKLQQLSSETDTTPNGKAFGVLGQLDDTTAADVAGAAMWRYELLPQLFENLLTQSAEDLVDPSESRAWLDRHPSLAADASGIGTALLAFGTFLASRGLLIGLAGVGLGRVPVIETLDLSAASQSGP